MPQFPLSARREPDSPYPGLHTALRAPPVRPCVLRGLWASFEGEGGEQGCGMLGSGIAGSQDAGMLG